MVATSLAETLRRRLDPRADPGRPLLTFYDDDSGERTELSSTTYANWVAKTAGVLVEDLDLAPGDLVRLALPTHWLGPVFLGAAWLAGLEVADEDDAALVIQGPAGPDDSEPGAGLRLHCALLPFAVAAREPLPSGILDFGTLWPGQPDAYLGIPGGPSSPAYAGRDQATLLAGPGSAERVLTDLDPTGPAGLEVFLDALIGGGSLVLVRHPDPEAWSVRATSERADRTVRDSQPPRS